jgi:hypothetical protein
MRIALILIFSLFIKVAMSQQIESIVGVAHAEAGPTVAPIGDAGDAADIIMTWLTSYAVVQCNNKLRPSLQQKLVTTIKKFKGTIQVGSIVEFLVLTNKFKCEVIDMVVKTQTVRIQNGLCNIKDYPLT